MIPGRIEIRGLRCSGRHGSSPDQQGEPVSLVVDLSVHVDLEPAASSDDLSHAVDVAELAAIAREVVAGPPRTLLESLAVGIAQLLLERAPGVDDVRVRVCRPEPPGLDAAEEAVELTLGRSG